VTTTWIQMRSGKAVDLLDPRPEQFIIEDVAHHLANLTRYTGAVFYSIAEHSVRASFVAEGLTAGQHDSAHLALETLGHDKAEAVVNDASSPMKRAMRALMPAGPSPFDVIEERVDRAMARAFGLPEQHSPVVKRADLIMLVTEKRDLLPGGEREWPDIGIAPLRERIVPWTREVAEHAFLLRFDQLSRAAREEAVRGQAVQL
jgi:5'-deoxynucleotidase YfbR-like HD superfamily hydrolase